MPEHAQRADSVISGVAARVRALRQEQGLTLEAFAERLGTSVQWAHRAESGENLTLRSLVKIADALGVSLLQVFEGVEKKER